MSLVLKATLRCDIPGCTATVDVEVNPTVPLIAARNAQGWVNATNWTWPTLCPACAAEAAKKEG